MRMLAGSARTVTAGPQKRMPCQSGLIRSSIRVRSARPTASRASTTSVVRKYLNFLASAYVSTVEVTMPPRMCCYPRAWQRHAPTRTGTAHRVGASRWLAPRREGRPLPAGDAGHGRALNEVALANEEDHDHR